MKDDSTDMPYISYMDKQHQYKLPTLTITAEGFERLLKNTVTSKACGPDNIPYITLKNCAAQLVPGLRAIFQLLIDRGRFPGYTPTYHQYLKRETFT